MHEFVVITTTSGDHTVAEQIAADLVDRRLVACAQIIGPIKSIYRWEGTVEFTEEVMLQLKTTTAHVEAVKETIDRLHPYDVPEVIVMPITDGSELYLKWLGDQTRPL
jgi:periplasmic divalent cation tolerance protein